jgi:D-sedoheptulose 7-phosphate isomerase
MDTIINSSIDKHRKALDQLPGLNETIKTTARLCIESLKNKGKIILMGNGGSAADAQHLAAELVGRFKRNRKPLAAIALSTNTSIMSAVANDFGFEEVFSRQVEALARPNDIVLGISTSGNSLNVIRAIEKAKELGIKTVGLLGNDGGSLAKLVDTPIVIAETETPHVQEIHILLGHIICDIIEYSFSG